MMKSALQCSGMVSKCASSSLLCMQPPHAPGCVTCGAMFEQRLRTENGKRDVRHCLWHPQQTCSAPCRLRARLQWGRWRCHWRCFCIWLRHRLLSQRQGGFNLQVGVEVPADTGPDCPPMPTVGRNSGSSGDPPPPPPGTQLHVMCT